MFCFVPFTSFSETFLTLRRIHWDTVISEGHAVAQFVQALRYKLEFYENSSSGSRVVPCGWEDRRTDMKFYENPFSGSRLVPCGWEDKRTDMKFYENLSSGSWVVPCVWENRLTDMKFYENPSSASRVVVCGWEDRLTNMTDLIATFRNFANAPKIIIF
jgi:hypothetical protein